jgi:hypothetical protein
MLLMYDTLWENNLYFVKDMPMICVNFIIVVVMISKKEIGDFTFVPLLVYSSYYIISCTPPLSCVEAEWVGAITPPPFCACISMSRVELYLIP